MIEVSPSERSVSERFDQVTRRVVGDIVGRWRLIFVGRARTLTTHRNRD